jgi:Holliday junction resolvasome RuvABC endonuclease subunit
MNELQLTRPILFVGIDPGASGGIAYLQEDEITTEKMPATPRDLFSSIYCAIDPPQRCVVALERVASMPKQGVASTFKFGRHYGMCEMAVVASEYEYYLITPGKWQRALGCLSKGDKNVTKQKAQQLWPTHKITHAIADAMLLAEYARRFLA